MGHKPDGHAAGDETRLRTTPADREAGHEHHGDGQEGVRVGARRALREPVAAKHSREVIGVDQHGRGEQPPREAARPGRQRGEDEHAGRGVSGLVDDGSQGECVRAGAADRRGGDDDRERGRDAGRPDREERAPHGPESRRGTPTIAG